VAKKLANSRCMASNCSFVSRVYFMILIKSQI
jgi:hypothetical protein